MLKGDPMLTIRVNSKKNGKERLHSDSYQQNE